MRRVSFTVEKTSWPLLGAVLLVSFSIITFEITLTRILSVLLSYHYVSIVLSLALLGLGIGGIFINFIETKSKMGKESLVLWNFLYSIALPSSTILMINITSMGHSKVIIIYGFILLIPFFFAGGLLAQVYQKFSFESARIYGIDLLGVAIGSLGAILLLNFFGGIKINFLLGSLTSIATSLFVIREKKIKALWIPLLTCLVFLFFILSSNLLNRDLFEIKIWKNPIKEIYDAILIFKGKVIETRWSAFGRTDLVKYSNISEHMDIYIDGTAGSPMYRFNGNINNPDPALDRLKEEFPGYFPFLHLKEEAKGCALVIGPGGGRDILLSLMGGVQKICAVEVNKDLVEIVKKFSWYNGGIYNNYYNVNVIVDEGRNFLKRQKEKYDIIMLSLPVTNTSRSLEGYALTENFLFTVESIHDYLDHLTKEGALIVVSHNDAEILRLLSTSLVALNQRGISTTEAMKQIYILGAEEYPLFVMKKIPFQRDEMLRAYTSLVKLGYEQQSSYFPNISEGRFNSVLVGLASGQIGLNEFINIVRQRGYDISPVSDNNPFFYKFERGAPRHIFIFFWLSILLLILLIIIPFLYKKRFQDFNSSQYLSKSIPLFLLLGMGFMMIEISLIQKFCLFLGHPVLSLSILLFSILGGAGLGSLWSNRIPLNEIRKFISRTAIIIALIVMSYVFFLPTIFNKFLGLDFNIRILITTLIIIPFSFFMGFPFPLGIRFLEMVGMRRDISWMWGINGVGSVLGSTLTTIIATNLGYTEAFMIGAGCYIIISFIFIFNKEDKKDDLNI